MLFGMGPAEWFLWPHLAYSMRYWYPLSQFPLWPPFRPLTKEEEEAILEDQVRMLEDQLAQVKKRLSELKKQEKEIK